jgi:hypothetical protein
VREDMMRSGALAAAATGIRLQGGPVSRAATAASRSARMVVPYAAVLYDARGDTWVYTNPQSLVFVRHRIHIDYIEGNMAVLSAGPPVGTVVVTSGAAELFGTEFKVGH